MKTPAPTSSTLVLFGTTEWMVEATVTSNVVGLWSVRLTVKMFLVGEDVSATRLYKAHTRPRGDSVLVKELISDLSDLVKRENLMPYLPGITNVISRMKENKIAKQAGLNLARAIHNAGRSYDHCERIKVKNNRVAISLVENVGIDLSTDISETKSSIEYVRPGCTMEADGTWKFYVEFRGWNGKREDNFTVNMRSVPRNIHDLLAGVRKGLFVIRDRYSEHGGVYDIESKYSAAYSTAMENKYPIEVLLRRIRANFYI